jgi:hypothetical protein
VKHVRTLVIGLSITLPAIAVACVLADPPPIQNPPTPTRPFILTDSVSPPADQKIVAPPTDTPLVFSVPVLSDPDQPLTFRVFVDLDQTSTLLPTKVKSGTDDGGATGEAPDAGDSVRVLGFQLATSDLIDFSQCHTFTFIVARDFIEDHPANPTDPPGGDQITWFYEPQTDCTTYDAAPPTYDLDAGDAGDGATE